MQKKNFFISVLFISGFTCLFSCATTGKAASAVETAHEVNGQAAVQPEAEKNTPGTAERDFKKKLENLELKVISSPRQTYKNKAFSEPFVIRASDADGKNIADLDITVSWPSARTNNSISYSTSQIKTDSEGKARFTAEIPSIAVNSNVTFYPTPVNSSPSVSQAAYAAGVTAQYKVKSDYMNYPGILYVYDFDENGRPITNSFHLLQDMRNSGVNVGNSPVSSTSYYDRPIETLYKATYDIIGKTYKFMVMGSFKFAKPVETSEKGVTCTLSADITCLDMADGSIIYKTQLTETTTDSNKNKAVEKCRSDLAQKTADALMYGM